MRNGGCGMMCLDKRVVDVGDGCCREQLAPLKRLQFLPQVPREVSTTGNPLVKPKPGSNASSQRTHVHYLTFFS